jgi:nicotinate-nucleotide adenylyltransferase
VNPSRRIPGITDLPPSAPGMRIGLFGGSFNPIHEGHVLVATQCLKRLKLDAVWLLVSPGNPLKDHGELASLEGRVTAARKAIRNPRIEVTGYEAAHGFHYTYDTLSHLRAELPGRKLVWIMGADSFRDFDRWERWETIAELLPMAIYSRPGAARLARTAKAATVLAQFRLRETEAEVLADADPPAWVFLTGMMSTQSSTALRAKAGV